MLAHPLRYQLLHLYLIIEARNQLDVVADILVVLFKLDDVAVCALAELDVFLLSDIPLLHLHHFFEACELHFLGNFMAVVGGGALLRGHHGLRFLEACLRYFALTPLPLNILVELSQISRIRINAMGFLLFYNGAGSWFLGEWGGFLARIPIRLLINLLDSRSI